MSSQQENPIHVKLLHSEAVDSKRDLLLSEGSFLKLLMAMKNYHNLRKEEFKLKSKLKTEMKKINSNINSIEKDMPDFKVPSELKKFKHPEEAKKKKENSYKRRDLSKVTNRQEYNKAINKQLEDINDRLLSLQ